MEVVRGGNGLIRNGDALETINAAITTIASTENRVPEAAARAQKRRWGSCWGIYWCFGYQKHSKRIGPAVPAPQVIVSRSELPAIEGSTSSEPATEVPIVAPPSSPASFVLSEPPSAAQSPAAMASLTSISSSISSPGVPRSIFAIGPYAHETQLVSPPVFSSFTTEPSTAPFTPPPESIHLTTPSSPEVPFAQLLDPRLRADDFSPRFRSSCYEFLSYQFYPGSPVGQLISPGSTISHSSILSPFPDHELAAAGLYFPDLQSREPSTPRSRKLPSVHGWSSQQGSGSLTPDAIQPTSPGSLVLDIQHSTLPLHPQQSSSGSKQNELPIGHRVSFELVAEDVTRVAKDLISSINALRITATTEDDSSCTAVTESNAGERFSALAGKTVAEGEDGQQRQKRGPVSLGSAKEFNFDSANKEQLQKSSVGSNWWTDEKFLDEEGESSKNWSFFPMIQPNVS